MLKQIQTKLHSVARPAAIRAILVLLALGAIALAAGAPHAWGGG